MFPTSVALLFTFFSVAVGLVKLKLICKYCSFRKVLHLAFIFYVPKTPGLFRGASLHAVRIFSNVGRIFVLGGS